MIATTRSRRRATALAGRPTTRTPRRSAATSERGPESMVARRAGTATAPRPRALPPAARPRRVAALLASLVLLVLAGPAAGTASAAAAEPADVAKALERSPVFIDPQLDGTISPAAGKRIERAIDRLDRDVYVVLVPLENEDRFEGRAREYLAALRTHIDRDGVFVVSESGDYLMAEEFRGGLERRSETLRDATTLANFADREPGDARRTLLQKVERLVALLRESPQRIAALTKAYDEESERRARERRSAPDSPFSRDRGGDGGGAGTVLVVLLVVALIGAGLAFAAWRRGRGARPAEGPRPVVPDRVFEHALAARRAELREDADGELLALATLLDEQPVPAAEEAQDAYQRALDAYTAARRCAVDDAPTVDVVGILVLVDQARGDLARAAALDTGRRPPVRTPLCAFHPLHGRSAKVVAWRRGLKVPACAACAAAVRRDRDPDALRDGDRPYFEGETVWARTGYGAFADDLVERVSRGER